MVVFQTSGVLDRVRKASLFAVQLETRDSIGQHPSAKVRRKEYVLADGTIFSRESISYLLPLAFPKIGPVRG
jgi:hypothetical protein